MDSAEKQVVAQPANAKDGEKDQGSVAEIDDEISGTRKEKSPGEDRLIALCDGIFAIATTLLVIDIRLPSGLKNDIAFNAALSDLLSNAVVFYLITFVIVASLWMQHRHMMRYIKYQNARFAWLTLLFLVFVAFFPVASGILESYTYAGAVIFYTLTFSGCGLSLVFMWLYASWHHRLIAPELPLEEILSFTVSLALTPVYFALSLLLLFFPVNPTTVLWSWLALPAFGFAFRLVSHEGLSSTLAKFLSHQLEGQ